MGTLSLHLNLKNRTYTTLGYNKVHVHPITSEAATVRTVPVAVCTLSRFSGLFRWSTRYLKRNGTCTLSS